MKRTKRTKKRAMLSAAHIVIRKGLESRTSESHDIDVKKVRVHEHQGMVKIKAEVKGLQKEDRKRIQQGFLLAPYKGEGAGEMMTKLSSSVLRLALDKHMFCTMGSLPGGHITPPPPPKIKAETVRDTAERKGR
jgi:hypothetical protein